MADDYVPYEVDDYPGDPSNYPDDIDNADDAYDEASAIIHNEDEPFENEDEQANIAAAAPVGSANRRFVTAVKRLIKSSGENISDSTIDNWALRSQKLPHFRYLSSRCLAMLWLWRGTADATVRAYSNRGLMKDRALTAAEIAKVARELDIYRDLAISERVIER